MGTRRESPPWVGISAIQWWSTYVNVPLVYPPSSHILLTPLLGICVGQQFALTEASYTIIRLLQEFRGIENRDSREWIEQINLTLATSTGVKVSMIPR